MWAVPKLGSQMRLKKHYPGTGVSFYEVIQELPQNGTKKGSSIVTSYKNPILSLGWTKRVNALWAEARNLLIIRRRKSLRAVKREYSRNDV